MHNVGIFVQLEMEIDLGCKQLRTILDPMSIYILTSLSN